MRNYLRNLIAGGIFLLACSSSANDVVVIRKTATYHRENCTMVMMAQTETMSRDEARALKMAPCSACQPDSSAEKTK